MCDKIAKPVCHQEKHDTEDLVTKDVEECDAMVVQVGVEPRKPLGREKKVRGHWWLKGIS